TGSGFPLTITADGVVVAGLEFADTVGGHVIRGNAVDNVQLVNNRLIEYTSDMEGGSGIQVTNASGWLIEGNLLQNLRKGSQGNHYAVGIRLTTGTGNTVTGNALRNVANAGIMVNLQQGASITDNLVQANSLGAGGESGVLLYTNSSTEVARNTMRNVQAGIFLQNGNASTVSVVCNLIESSFYGVRA